MDACSRVSGRLVSHFLAFVSHFFPKQFTFRGSQFFLKMLSALCVTAGVRPFPLAAGRVAFVFICLPGLSLLVSALFSLAMRRLYSFVSQVCHWWCPPFSAMQEFCSFVSQVCHCRCPPFSAGHVTVVSIVLFICFPGLSRWCPPFSAGHVGFLFVCLPGLSLLVSALFRWPCSISIHES